MKKSQKQEYGTIKALKSLAEKLDFSLEKSMQDWSHELSKKNQLKEVLHFYDLLNNEDEKFVLMEIMVQAASDQFQASGLCNSWASLGQRLIWDFNIHKQNVHHWSCRDKDKLNLRSPISSDMRDLLSRSQAPRTKLLFVCTVNLMRSATAHQIYRNDMRFEVKSAGTHRSAETVLSQVHLNWSDTVVVMEERHSNFIQKAYPEAAKGKKIVCLDVPDNYDYMQPELISLLRDRFEEADRRRLI